MPIRVFLVEDRDNEYRGLNAMLSHAPEVEIVGEACNESDLFPKIAASQPEVLIVNLKEALKSVMDLTRALKRNLPETKILILGMQDQASYLIDLLDAGADGCILAGSLQEDVLFAIKKVAADHIYIGPEFILNILAIYKATRGFPNHARKNANITDREMDVLHLVAQGHTNVEIARQLFTSVRTIETRRKNLLEKTGTINTATLIRFSILNGLIN